MTCLLGFGPYLNSYFPFTQTKKESNLTLSLKDLKVSLVVGIVQSDYGDIRSSHQAMLHEHLKALIYSLATNSTEYSM